MQLCVLEDRLLRISALSMADVESKPLLIQVCRKKPHEKVPSNTPVQEAL